MPGVVTAGAPRGGRAVDVPDDVLHLSDHRHLTATRECFLLRGMGRRVLCISLDLVPSDRHLDDSSRRHRWAVIATALARCLGARVAPIEMVQDATHALHTNAR
jgi:hypothetical protein